MIAAAAGAVYFARSNVRHDSEVFSVRAIVTHAAPSQITPPPQPVQSIANGFVAAANKLPLVTIPAIAPPPLEDEREELESHAGVQASDDVRIVSGFECSTPIEVQKLSASHFKVAINGRDAHDWFIFRVACAAGKTIRIDITGGDIEGSWTSLNPVYSYCSDLDDPATYATEKAGDVKASIAWNGPVLSSTQGQGWHFIENCWMDDDQVFSLVQHFDNDTAYVAMRVPYSPGYNEQFMKQLAGNPQATVIEVGRSRADRPLQLVKISSGDEETERQKPCVLIYGGEHADEHDAMWAAQGAIQYLLGNTVEAKALRDRVTILVIPVLDPDTSVIGIHQGIITSFLSANETPESIAYANWFQSWIDAGKRLDIIFDLHNVQSDEAPHLSCALIEGVGIRGMASAALHNIVTQNMKAAGFLVSTQPWGRGWSPDRLGGWLSRRYGPITLAYELNSQARAKHLSVEELKQMGYILAKSVSCFLGHAS